MRQERCTARLNITSKANKNEGSIAQTPARFSKVSSLARLLLYVQVSHPAN